MSDGKNTPGEAVTYTREELNSGIPAVAQRRRDPEYGNEILANYVLVRGWSGEIQDLADADNQRREVVGDKWQAKDLQLRVQAGPHRLEFDDIDAKWCLAVTSDRRLLLSIERGRTPFGVASDEQEKRRLVTFNWDLADVRSVYVGRIRKLGRWWNEEVIIEATDGTGRLVVRQLEPYIGGSTKALVKSFLPSNAAGVASDFITQLAEGVAQARTGRSAQWNTKPDGKEEEWDLVL